MRSQQQRDRAPDPNIWQLYGTTTSGAPDGPCEDIGIAGHQLIYRGMNLVRRGNELHLFLGDWCMEQYQIFKSKRTGGFLAVPLTEKTSKALKTKVLADRKSLLI